MYMYVYVSLMFMQKKAGAKPNEQVHVQLRFRVV